MMQEQILGTEAWQRLDNYVNFLCLREGQQALAQPETAAARGEFVRGVQFIRTCIQGALEEIEVVEDQEKEEEDKDLMALTSLGATDPG